jgi:uncharacterized protein DUF4845
MSQFRRPISSQRGASLLGMVVIAIVVGFFMLMGARVFPSVNEYLTIRRAVSQIMKNSPSSASEIRTAFERTSEVEYSIKSIGPKDLVITPVGERLRTSYAYNVEIPIIEPVFLLVKYEGSAMSGGR